MNEKLIARQAITIDCLLQRLARSDIQLREIRSLLFSLGGPLNDNKDEYTREQLEIFFQIKEILDDV